ncbi:hypothetical protein ALC57_16749, partial [Trachymyrmex cornetzi]
KINFHDKLRSTLLNWMRRSLPETKSPLLDKSLKPTLDTTISNEWLYSDKFRDMVKEAKSIDKAVTNINCQDSAGKSTTNLRNQGNKKGPSAGWKQVGNYFRRPSIRFRPRTQGIKQPQKKSTNHVLIEDVEPIIIEKIRKVNYIAGRLQYFTHVK